MHPTRKFNIHSTCSAGLCETTIRIPGFAKSPYCDTTPINQSIKSFHNFHYGGFEKPGFLVKIETGGILKPDHIRHM